MEVKNESVCPSACEGWFPKPRSFVCVYAEGKVITEQPSRESGIILKSDSRIRDLRRFF